MDKDGRSTIWLAVFSLILLIAALSSALLCLFLLSLEGASRPSEALIALAYVGIGVASIAAAILAVRRFVKAELERLSLHDELTGALTKDAWLLLAKRSFYDSMRNDSPLCILALSVDGPDDIKKRFGAQGLKASVREAGRLLAANVRKTDVLARSGEAAFLIAAPGIALAQAGLFAEKLRLRLEEAPMEPAGYITASIGIAMLIEGESLEGLVARAERESRRAAAAGGNRFSGHEAAPEGLGA